MKVKKLIKQLLELPQNANVKIIYDGESRLKANAVWLARSGDVMITQIGELVTCDNDRPEQAPSCKRSEYWKSKNY